MEQEVSGENRSGYVRDLFRLSVILYPITFTLSNLYIVGSTYAYNHEVQEHGLADGLSRQVGAVATRMAGYEVGVACLDAISDVSDDDIVTQGGVARYKLVDPLLNTHVLDINPRALKLKSAYCNDIIEDQASASPLWEHRDDFRAYALLIHEIIHLEETRYDDETGTQCEAISSMPRRLEQVGFTAEEAVLAAQYAGNESRYYLTNEYHEYPCSSH